MRGVVPLLIATLLAPPAWAGPFDVSVSRKSRRHARVVLAPRASRDATLVVAFRVGAADDGIRAGLTRLTQHLLLDGNRREPPGQLRRDLYAAAADLELITGPRRATFVLRAPSERFTELAERVLTMTLDGEIDRTALERGRLLTLRDELDGASRPALESAVAGELFLAPRGAPRGADYRTPPYGDPDIVRSLAFDDVEAHREKYFRPANATVVLAGAFDRGRLVRTLRRLKGGRAAKLLVPSPAQGADVLSRRGARAVAYQVHTVSLDDAQQAAAARVMLAILEDRLRRRLPQPSALSMVRTWAFHRLWGDGLVVEVPGGDAGTDATLAAVTEEVRAGGLEEGEFARNRTFALRAIDREDATPLVLAPALAFVGKRGVWHSRDVKEALENLSQADMTGYAKDWLKSENTVRVHVGGPR